MIYPDIFRLSAVEIEQAKLQDVIKDLSLASGSLQAVQAKLAELQGSFAAVLTKLQAKNISIVDAPSLNNIEHILEAIDARLSQLDEEEERLKLELKEKLKGSYLEDDDSGLDPLFFDDDVSTNLEDDDFEADLAEDEEVDSEEGLKIARRMKAVPGEVKLTEDLGSEDMSSEFKLAPFRTPKTGTFKIGLISLKFLDGKSASGGTLNNIARKLKSVYSNISGGEVNFETEARVIRVNYTHDKKNLRSAERSAKKQMGYKNVYAICNNRVKKVSTGAGNTAHIIGTLARDWYHEIGHCRPWTWGHAGRYRLKIVGKGRNKRTVRVYESYGDGTSFMGRFESAVVNGAQAYDAGFLNGKVAQYDFGGGDKVYPFETLFGKHKEGFFQGVMIPGAAGERDLIVSTATKKGETFFGFYLRNPSTKTSSSSMDGRFTNEGQYAGLSFKVEELANGKGMGLRIRPSA